MEIDIGSKIKELRKEKDMTITELSEQSDVSAALISQIERNIVNPSIMSLWKIAKSLNVPVGYFFNEEEIKEPNPIVKRGNRKRIVTTDTNAIYELLSPDLNRKIEFLSITIHPGESSNKELVSHEGEECGIVLKGKLLVRTSEDDYALEEGDSVYLNSTTPHRYINAGDDVCISIWAMTPPKW